MDVDSSRLRTTSLVDPAQQAAQKGADEGYDPLAGAMHGMNMSGGLRDGEQRSRMAASPVPCTWPDGVLATLYHRVVCPFRQALSGLPGPARPADEKDTGRGHAPAPRSPLIAWTHAPRFGWLPADEAHVTTVRATSGDIPERSVERDIQYGDLSVVGNGSFGVVFRTKLTDQEGCRTVALKKVLQDRRYKVGTPLHCLAWDGCPSPSGGERTKFASLGENSRRSGAVRRLPSRQRAHSHSAPLHTEPRAGDHADGEALLHCASVLVLLFARPEARSLPQPVHGISSDVTQCFR